MVKQKKSVVKKVIFHKAKLNAWELGLAGGIISGLSVLIMTLLGKFFGLYSQLLNLVADMYGFLGYDVTIFGAFLGGVLAFIDCFIFFWLLASLYNKFR
ncbi:hypothetical protein HOD29_01675 [archaeon]|nr:hypothetical protein [archaeon]